MLKTNKTPQITLPSTCHTLEQISCLYLSFHHQERWIFYNSKRFETTPTILAVYINFGLGQRWIFTPQIKNNIWKQLNYIRKFSRYNINETIRCIKLAYKVWFQIKNTNLPNYRKMSGGNCPKVLMVVIPGLGVWEIEIFFFIYS